MSSVIINFTSYPTPYEGGNTKGSIVVYQDKAFIAKVNDKAKYFYFSKYNSKEEAGIAADKYLYEECKRLDLLTNEYRYLDENTVEMKLSLGQTMLIDKEDLETAKLYKLTAKKSREYFYPVYLAMPKIHYNFANLIVSAERIEYKNGNRCDLRKQNLITDVTQKHEVKKEVNNEYKNTMISVNSKTEDIYEELTIEENLQDYDETFTFENIDIDTNSYRNDYKELPIGKWCLGKIGGTIFKRKNSKIYTVTIKLENNKIISKTFNPEHYMEKAKSDETLADKLAKIDAIKWRLKNTVKFGNVTNMIKRLDNDTIKVHVKDNYFFITDYKFYKDIQQYPVCLTYSGGNENSKCYIVIVIDGKNQYFHNYITKNKMTDHINRLPLDNRLSNLKATTIKENNNNKHITPKNTSGCVGVRKIEYKKTSYYEARIKQNGTEESKLFSIDDLGEAKAFYLAVQHRKKLNIKYGCKNGMDENGEMIII
jgi:hypothetical protein